MRVLVCGGRTYEERKVLGKVLSDHHAITPISLMITGGAAGADRLAQSWAEHHKIPVAVYPANWNFVGRAAGPIRNASMLEFGKPDLLLAFPGGPGTRNMIAQATAANVAVIEVTP